MEEENETKYNNVIQYFKKLGIEVPEEVKNALYDAFEENENIKEVFSYFKNDLTDFEEDLKLKKYIYVDKNFEKSFIKVENVFSYYGAVNFSLDEKTMFLNEGEIIEEITSIETGEKSSLEDPLDYAIIVLERLEWNGGKEENRDCEIFIFCPIEMEE